MPAWQRVASGPAGRISTPRGIVLDFDQARVAVERVLCTGHGVCAQTLPGAIELDEWGYPIIRQESVAAGDATPCGQAVPGQGPVPALTCGGRRSSEWCPSVHRYGLHPSA